MQVDRPDHGYQRIGTFDIETTHYKPEDGEVVSIGVGVHERGTPLSDTTVRQFHRRPNRDEETVIEQAYSWLDDQDPDFLVSFNGRNFDLPFTDERLSMIQASKSIEPDIATEETHLDLLHDDRKEIADEMGDDWPNLEEVIKSYTGEEPSKHYWRGDELTNTRFGEELGPAYLDAVERENHAEMASLEVVIDAYLRQDLLHNLQIYYHDIGEF